VGLRVRNASYRATLAEIEHGISTQTATNDLRELVTAGLLVQKGAKRGAHYVAAAPLQEIAGLARSDRKPISSDGLFDLEPMPVAVSFSTSESVQHPELFEFAGPA
jgi:hypothetical protein